MKKIITLLSTALIVIGLKAQKANVQKETVKPKANAYINSRGSKLIIKGSKKSMKKIPSAAQKIAPVFRSSAVSIKSEKQVTH